MVAHPLFMVTLEVFHLLQEIVLSSHFVTHAPFLRRRLEPPQYRLILLHEFRLLDTHNLWVCGLVQWGKNTQ